MNAIDGLRRIFAPLPQKPAVAEGAHDALYRKYRWSVIVALTLAYGMSYTCRLGLSVVKKPLIDIGLFTAAELGMVGAAFKWSYGAGKFFNGFIADRVNVARFWPFGLFIAALTNLFMGFNTALVVAVVLWGVNGWFQGFGAPSSAVSITQWFSQKERGTVYMIWNASHGIGEGLTFSVVAWLVATTSWNTAFFVPGIWCVVVALLATRFMKDRPQAYGLSHVSQHQHRHFRFLPTRNSDQAPAKDQSVENNNEKPRKSLSQFSSQLSIMKSPAIWIVCLSSAAMYVTRYAVNDWGVLYLQEEHGYTLGQAAGYIAISTTTGIVGSIAYGLISDGLFRAKRPPVTLLFGILEIGGLFLIFSDTGKDPLLLSIGFALYGFTLFGLLGVLGGLFAVDLSPKNAAGTAMGMVGIFSYIGAGLQDIISGALIDANSVKDAEGVMHYDFSVPVAFWCAASILSMILAATLWNAKHHDDSRRD